MNKLFLLFCVAVTNLIQGQTNLFHPYDTGHCEWYYESVVVDNTPVYHYGHMDWGGDTLILGQIYTKVAGGGFRQDPVTHQMFYIGQDDTEYDITINQDMETGDTLFFRPYLQVATRLDLQDLFIGDPYAIVREVDSVLVANQYRKVFVLGDYNSQVDYHNEFVALAAGIGVISYNQFEHYGRLVCYTENDVMKYGAPQDPMALNCTALFSDIPGKVKLNIFPNPSVGEIALRYDESIAVDRIFISDLNGKTVQEVESSHFIDPLDISSLRAGVYFVNIESGGYVSQEKLVKIN